MGGCCRTACGTEGLQHNGQRQQGQEQEEDRQRLAVGAARSADGIASSGGRQVPSAALGDCA